MASKQFKKGVDTGVPRFATINILNGRRNGNMETDDLRFKDLPMFLTIEDIGRILRVSKTTALLLAKRPSFPAIRVKDKKIIVPLEKFKEWINEEAEKDLTENPSSITQKKTND